MKNGNNDRSIDRRKKFFYAEAEAGMYDETVSLTVPLYHLAQQTLLQIFEYFQFDKQVEDVENTLKGTILDIGIGTGAESIPLLEKYSNVKVVGLDLCDPMKVRFFNNLEKRNLSNSRSRVVYELLDIVDPKCADGQLKDLNRGKGFICGISAYTIHHLEDNLKYQAYKNIYDSLRPGALFMNLDLYNYGDSNFSMFAHDFDITYTQEQFENPHTNFVGAREIPIQKRRKLKDLWIKHFNEDNILGSIEEQANMLKEIGFKNVQVPFRYWQQGILLGVK